MSRPLLLPLRMRTPSAIKRTRKPRKKSDLERFAQYVWTYKTTTAGKWVIAANVFAASMAIWTLDIPIYHLLTALSGLTGAAWALGLALRPLVRIAGEFPSKATVGETITGTFHVTNRSRFPIFDLALGFFELPGGLQEPDTPATRSSLARKQTAVLPARLVPRRRGLYGLPPLRAYSSFPFGIFRSGSCRQPMGSLLVLPRFHPLIGVNLPVGSRYQPGGVALTSNIGESPEYIGNRDYRPGDPLRRIDFRCWARLARPVSREFQEEYYCRIALVLDTFVPRRLKAGAEGFPSLEAAISFAAAVADAMTRGEYLIDIFAAGPELYVFRAGRHTAHLENILEILACVEPCRENPFERIAPALSDELGSVSTVVCVLLDWDESRESLVRAAREAGCSTKVIVVRDTDTTRPLDGIDDAGGEILQVTTAAVLQGGVDAL